MSTARQNLWPDVYVTRPVQVRAFRWDGENTDALAEWLTHHEVRCRVGASRILRELEVTQGEDVMLVHSGEWFVLHEDGNLDVHDHEDFTHLYDHPATEEMS